MDLNDVADELYGLPTGEFTARRDALAADAKKSGEPELAAAIKKLRRPSVSAWLANLLVRERGGELSKLLDLGAAMRDAQRQLAAGELRTLSQQRHQVIQSLAGEAQRLGEAAGQTVSEPVRRELEGTLEAALADEAASAALREGRLTGALMYSGLGPVEVSTVDRRPATPVKARRGRRDQDAGRLIQEAQAAVADAQREAEEHDRLVQEATEERVRSSEAVEDLKGRLEEARGADRLAHQALRDATRARDDAATRLRAAQEALARAEAGR